MTITHTKIPGVCILTPQVFSDERGWFMESYSRKKLEKLGIQINFVQDNQSYTAKKGTLRGLHCQLAPYAQAKLVRVLRGAVLDVAVDVREGSPTFMQWISVTLSHENKKQILVPRGCLHGVLTLVDDTEILYQCDQPYSPEYDRSIRWDDPALGVQWHIDAPIVSHKDASSPYWNASDVRFSFDG